MSYPSIRILILLFLSSILFTTEGQGQALTKIKEWQLKEIENVAVDRIGNFFLLSKKGIIKKYDPDGKVMASLDKTKPTLIEPWYHPSIFIYNRASQKYFIYGRYFENVKEHKVPAEFAIEPFLVCPTHDNRLWIWDNADHSLKKINPFSNEVLNEFVLPIESSKANFINLKEYQNLLFLQQKESIWIINTLGQIVNKIENPQLGNFGFFGQELYYLQNNIIHFVNLLNEERYDLKLDGDIKFALVTDERILTVSNNNKVYLYQYKPE